jgi:hypothetical protein
LLTIILALALQGSPAKVLFAADLAKTLQEEVSVQDEFATEVLIVNAPRAGAQDVIERAASVLDAKVTRDGDSLRISRDSQQSDALRAEEIDRLGKAIRSADWLATLPKGDSTKEALNEAKVVFSQWMLAASRGDNVEPTILVRELLSSLLLQNADSLDVSVNETVDFSNYPNKYQSKLETSTDLVRRYNQITAQMIEILPAEAPAIGDPTEQADLVREWTKLRANAIAPVDKFILTIANTPERIFASLTVYDKDGMQRGFSSVMLTPPAHPDDLRLAAMLTRAEPVPLLPDAEQWMRIPKSITQAVATNYLLSAEDSKRLIAVDENDPVSHVVAPGIDQLAADLGAKYIMARVSDRMLLLEPEYARDGHLNLRLFYQSLAKFHSVQVDGDWLIIKPNRPLVCESERLDRHALGHFLASCNASKRLDDETADRWFFENGPPTPEQLSYWQSFLTANGVSKGNALASLDRSGRLRVFLGSLPTPLRQRLEREGRLALDYPSLSQASREALAATFVRMQYKQGASGPDILCQPSEWRARFGLEGVRVEVSLEDMPTVTQNSSDGSGAFRSTQIPISLSAEEMSAALGPRIAAGVFHNWQEAMPGTWFAGHRPDATLRVSVESLTSSQSRPGIPVPSIEARPADRLSESWKSALQRCLSRDYGIKFDGSLPSATSATLISCYQQVKLGTHEKPPA